MPKFPPIPRLSIVIPIGQDLAAFESTLVSVLENQPVGSEVIVAHDGQYDDPFELCDEVTFVTAVSGHTVDLIAAGSSRARGRFVHVLGDGIRATPGWTDDALEKFEHYDAGLVVPVIRSQATNLVLAAGWHDSSPLLCRPAAAGAADVDPAAATATAGSFLAASFWRRELIRSVCAAYAGESCGLDVSYLLSRLVTDAGWRCVVASESTLRCDGDSLPWPTNSVQLGRRLVAVNRHFAAAGKGKPFRRACRAVLTSLLKRNDAKLAWGQFVGSLNSDRLSEQIHASVVPHCDSMDEVIMSLPQTDWQASRRAA